MKIQSIKPYNNDGKYLNNISHNKVVTNPHSEDSNGTPQQVFASHLGFKGNPTVESLMKDYKWFINHDRVSAIESFLKLIAPPKIMEDLFNNILRDENAGYEFIDSIVKQPRLTGNYYKKLKEKLPEQTEAFYYFMPQNSYKIAYENYMNKRVQNTSSISELLTIRPDWKEEVLLQKHKELYHNDDFELGVVPESIGAENFQPIIQYLEGYMDYGYKTTKTISDLTINGKTFQFKNIIDGKSDKNVFLIETPDKENFIIKIANPANRGLNKPFAIGTCSIIDTYLTRNNCRNSAPLRYYNHNSNTAIYDFIQHKTTRKIVDLPEFQEKMPDFTNLGLYHSDTVGTNNYFILDNSQKAMERSHDFEYGVRHQELVSVDNDHVTYNNPLNPPVDKYHKDLPVAMQMFF